MNTSEEKVPVDLLAHLHTLHEKGGSDLHLIPGSPPRMRVDGRLIALDADVIGPDDTRHLVDQWMTPGRKACFEESLSFDCSLTLESLGRFRVHVYRQRGAPAIAVRAIPSEIPSFDQLGLPAHLEELVKKPRGLLLVTGPAGSGKSTTMAAMVDYLNATRRVHILTIEDPIEFLHPHKKSLVSQREIGTDVPNVVAALRSVLRQDPDLVLLGELRDREMIEAGLTIAETGHLTLATLHTNSCVQTLHRLIDVFPAHQQSQVRAQLALVLEGILSQALIPKMEGRGRVLALEILIPTPAVRNLIRDDKIHQIYSVMQTGQAKHGMQTMNQALVDLVRRRLISAPTALARSSFPDELRGMLDRAGAVTRLGGGRVS